MPAPRIASRFFSFSFSFSSPLRQQRAREISGCRATFFEAGPDPRGRDNSTVASSAPLHRPLSNDYAHTPDSPDGVKTKQPQETCHSENSHQIFSHRVDQDPSQAPPQINDYNLSKVGLHARLWQKEIKSKLGDVSPDMGDADSLSTDKCLQKMGGSLSDDWESFARPGESLENFHEERAVKEESMMLEEFERRKEHDRVQIANFVKQHLYARRRPVDGWKYIVNSFGVNKGAKSSAFQLDESRASELEKLALKREIKPRRRT